MHTHVYKCKKVFLNDKNRLKCIRSEINKQHVQFLIHAKNSKTSFRTKTSQQKISATTTTITMRRNRAVKTRPGPDECLAHFSFICSEKFFRPNSVSSRRRQRIKSWKFNFARSNRKAAAVHSKLQALAVALLYNLVKDKFLVSDKLLGSFSERDKNSDRL